MTKMRFGCRDDRCPALIEYRPTGGGREQFACPRCGRQYELPDTDAGEAGITRCAGVLGGVLTQCVMCHGEELFIRKAFPQKTGLFIVVVAALTSILFLKSNPAIAYGVLAAAVLIDLLIYLMTGVVTVCYRCRTEYWGQARNENHNWFDLASSEKYP